MLFASKLSFILKKCSTRFKTCSDIKRSYCAFKLKKRKEISHSVGPWNSPTQVSDNYLHYAVSKQYLQLKQFFQWTIQEVQYAMGSLLQLLGAQHFPHCYLQPASPVMLICSFPDGYCYGHVQSTPPPCSFSEIKNLKLRADLLIAQGHRFYTQTAKNFRPHSNNKGSARCCPIQENNFLGSELYLLLWSPLQGFSFFLIQWKKKKLLEGRRKKNTSQ